MRRCCSIPSPWPPGLALGVLLVCLWGRQATSADTETRLEVDLFVAVDCPIANAYAPEINRLHREFSPRGVRFRLVYPDVTLGAVEMERHRDEYALEPEATLDSGHALVERAGATVTPEAAVFDEEGRLRYRGRIDNLFTDYGEKRRVVTERELAETLRALLAGDDLAFREVKAVGCLIEPVASSG